MDLLYDGIEKSTSMILLLAYGLYWIFKINVPLGWVAILLMTVSLLVATKANINSSNARKKRVEAEHEMGRNITRILMSKNEMLQNQESFKNTLIDISLHLNVARKLQTIVQKWVRFMSTFPL